jgi:hypothetical protein
MTPASATSQASPANEQGNVSNQSDASGQQQPATTGRPRLRFDLSTPHGKERMMALANALLQKLAAWKKAKTLTAVNIMNDLNKQHAFQIKGVGALSKSTAELKLNEIWSEAQARREAMLRGERVEQDDFGLVLDNIWLAHEGQQLEVHIEAETPAQPAKRLAEQASTDTRSGTWVQAVVHSEVGCKCSQSICIEIFPSCGIRGLDSKNMPSLTPHHHVPIDVVRRRLKGVFLPTQHLKSLLGL